MANVLIAFLVICVGCAVAVAVVKSCWLALRESFAARGRLEASSEPVAVPAASVVPASASVASAVVEPASAVATGRRRTWLHVLPRSARKRRAAAPV